MLNCTYCCIAVLLVQRGGDWAEPQLAPRPLLAVPNVAAHLSTSSVPNTVLLQSSVALRFSVPIKGLMHIFPILVIRLFTEDKVWKKAIKKLRGGFG